MRPSPSPLYTFSRARPSTQLVLTLIFGCSPLVGWSEPTNPPVEPEPQLYYPGGFPSPQTYLDAVRAQRKALVDNETRGDPSMMNPAPRHDSWPRNTIELQRKSIEEQVRQRHERVDRMRQEWRMRTGHPYSGSLYFQGWVNPWAQLELPPAPAPAPVPAPNPESIRP